MSSHREEALDRLLESLRSGSSTPVDPGLEAGMFADSLELHSLSLTPMPGAARERARRRVFDSSTSAQENTMTALTLPAAVPASNGHNANVRFPVIPSLPARKTARKAPWAWLSVAAALLILLASVGGWIAYDRYGSDDSAPAVIPAVQATPESGWLQMRGGADGAAYTTDPGPGGDLALRWTFTAPEIMSNLVSDSTSVYVYGRAGDLFALDDATGAQRWGVDLSPNEYADENLWPSPAVHNGIIYVGTFDGNMVALDVTDGSVIWQRALATLPIRGSALIVEDALYVLTPAGTIVALDAATGVTRWESSNETLLSNWASAIGGGVHVTPASDGSLVAINIATGATQWITDVGGARRAVAFADGTVYGSSQNGSFYAVDATDGSVLWTSEPFTENDVLSPVVTPTQLIATWINGPMMALDRATGEVIWTVEDPGASASPNASATAVYVVSRDRSSLVAYDLDTGNELGRVDVEGLGLAAISTESIVFGSPDNPGVIRSYGAGDGDTIAVTAGPTTVLDPATAVAAETLPDAASESTFDSSQVSFVWDLTAIGETTLQAPVPVIGPDSSLYVANLNGTTYILSRDAELIGELSAAGSIGFDADGNIYVFDNAATRIKKFAPDYSLLTEWGSPGSGNGQFGEIYGTVDPVNGLVYTVDFDNNRVQVFDLEGNFVDKWGSTGRDDGEFVHPVVVQVGPDGLVYVGEGPENGASRVQIFDRFGTFKGTLLDADGNMATFSEAYGLAFDSVGNIYVSDYFGHSIRVFDSQWREIGVIADVEGAGPFTYPIQLAIDAEDNLFVGDFFGDGDFGRIVKLALPREE